MTKFDTKNTKTLLIIFILTMIFVILSLGYAIDFWDDDPTKSFKLISISGIVLQIAGFIFLLNPDFVKFSRKKEGSVKFEGILFVVAGSIFEGFSISASFFL